MNACLRRGAAVALGAALAALALAPSAGAVSLTDRTFLMTIGFHGEPSNGVTQNPHLSANGRILTFDSTATNLVASDPNGAQRDVFAMDTHTGERALMSSTPGGANGPSFSAVSSHNGRVVAFTSEASNLVPGDTNGVADVFIHLSDGSLTRVSIGPDGAQANGPSYEPDLSDDGRILSFTSEATNLGDLDTNGHPDVYMYEVDTGATRRVSLGPAGQGNGRSSQPAVSGNGAFVAFESGADNLVPDDTNNVSDVFVVDLAQYRIQRVSVSGSGRQQNRSVAPPFKHIPDISGDGRYVVFDSDATNLVEDDRNRRTDIFRYDRQNAETLLVSASTEQVQGNNDSFAPRITPSGGFVAFQSFASNLVQGDDGPREDIFVRDLRYDTTTVASVTNDGSPRQPELVGQLLQRPVLSADGTIAAFASSSPNLVANDTNSGLDVFIRRLNSATPALRERVKTSRRPLIKLTADDPRVNRFLCQVDNAEPQLCAATWRVPPLPDGRHTVTVRAGGPGLMWTRRALRVPITVRSPGSRRNDRADPSVRIRLPRRGASSLRTVRGTARDRGRSGISRVEVAVTYLARRDGTCEAYSGKRFVVAKCTRKIYVRATGRRNWRLRLPRSIKGPIAIWARATDKAGNRSRVAVARLVLV